MYSDACDDQDDSRSMLDGQDSQLFNGFVGEFLLLVPSHIIFFAELTQNRLLVKSVGENLKTVRL